MSFFQGKLVGISVFVASNYNLADPDSWKGPRPKIWAAELHRYRDKCYNFATFTNREVKIDTVKGNVIERWASHILISDKAEGPYVPMDDPIYLPADKPTLDGQLLMVVHSHRVGENGRYIRIPKLFEVDDSGDKLVLGQPFNGNGKVY